MIRATSIACAIVAVSACSSPAEESPVANSHDDKPREAGFVSAEMLQNEGKAWPLSVPEAVVGCDKAMLLWVRIEGDKYGLNGSAKDFGYPDFRQYWLFDKKYLRQGEKPVDGATPRVAIQPLFDRAQDLCST